MLGPHGGEIIPFSVNYKSVSNSSVEYILAVFIITFVLLLLTALFIRIIDFLRQIKYINIEIKRTKGEEKRYWISKKKILWCQFFLGRF